MEALAGPDLSDEAAVQMLAAIFEQGMEKEELFGWTQAMLESGEQLRWSHMDGPILDKHSTGGVGDKVSLPLAPALAACGARVPMISGRGLGHTGGTLDKLEAIPGFNTALSVERIGEILSSVGAVIAAQTAELVPADCRLYALRDATNLVASEPLIASSIMSKKLAEGLGALVLDVKYGTGATAGEPALGEQLARTMLDLSQRFGLQACAFQTSMDEPLGHAIGHTLELDETLDCLRGGGPSSLREVTATLGGALLALGGLASDEDAGKAAIEARLDDGAALTKFGQMIAAQGGDEGIIDHPDRMPRAPKVALWKSPASGLLDVNDCRELGLAVADLGGARSEQGGDLDHGVGMRWLQSIGTAVQAGEPLAELYYQRESELQRAQGRLAKAVSFDTGRPLRPLVLQRLDP